ncbi:uncharacterized protein LOC127871719 [Dreissena polymorpha]|uniref:uncharacterized protein LOC127871719 n=1 Tax=Dreissena polymorpha TaxID=45954 RepID=UPI0022654550|nr:uncharacterized protein LOC127871719 [Dreissena polymorpha]
MAFHRKVIFLVLVFVYTVDVLTFQREPEDISSDDTNRERPSVEDAAFQDGERFEEVEPRQWCQCVRSSCVCCVDRLVTAGGQTVHMSASVAIERWSSISYDVSFTVNGLRLYKKVQKVDDAISECFPVSGNKQEEICFTIERNCDSKECVTLSGTYVERGKTKIFEQDVGCFMLPV